MFSHDDRDPDSPSLSDADASGESTAGSAADVTDPHLVPSALGSGLLAQQPTPAADEAVAIAKICPQCGSEYETGDRFCPKDGSPLRPKLGGDPLIGRVIADRYLILARIGEGGMGRVYLAEHVKMTRQCAIKVMNPNLVNDGESLQRFAREASNAARILHPNVAAVFDYGEAERIVYLVMEYVDGESLSTILAREKPLDPRRAIDIARQVADGLSAAHELGIVHRDLKPDNVIVARTRNGKEIPKVVDFGIAKAVSESPQDALTRSGLVIGTPEYMSPEQLLGDPVDARADIYSLGCILYQMLTGEPAFAGDTREQMIRRRLHEAPPHVRDTVPSLPRRLDTLIVHMLARSPSDRLASAADARDQLDPGLALGGWDPSSITTPRPTPQNGVKVPRISDPSLQPTMPLPRQRVSVSRIGVGTVIGSALLLGGLTVWQGMQQAPPSTVPPVSVDSTRPSDSTARIDSTATPKPGVAVKPPSSVVGRGGTPVPPIDTTKLVPKPAAVTSDTDGVKRAFEPLVAAIRSGDIALLQSVFPEMPEKERNVYVGLYNGSVISRVERVFQDVRITGDNAEVGILLRVTRRTRNTADALTVNRQYGVTLARVDGSWRIVKLATESP